MECGEEEEGSRLWVWCLLQLCGQLKSSTSAGWSVRRIAQKHWWAARTKNGHWHHSRWGRAAALTHPQRPPHGCQLQYPKVLPWCPGSASWSWPRTGRWPAGPRLPRRVPCLPGGRCPEPGCSQLPADPTPGTRPLQCPPAWGARHSQWSGLPHPAVEAGSPRTG